MPLDAERIVALNDLATTTIKSRRLNLLGFCPEAVRTDNQLHALRAWSD